MRARTIAAAGALLLLTACANAGPAARAAGPASTAATVVRQTHPAPTSAASRTTAAWTTAARTTAARTSSAPTGSHSPVVARTRQVVLRPVTAQGTVAAGYTVTRRLADQIECFPGADAQSRVAVDPNILDCSPSALSAVACWAARAAHTALCYLRPGSPLMEYSVDGPMPTSKVARRPSPLSFRLTDGRSCTIRDGGAWGTVAGHPELSGTYYCDGNVAAWGRYASDGIDRSHPQWTVQLSPMSGQGGLTTATVATAYFVGTAAG